MKPGFYRLVRAACVVSSEAHWGPQALGAGSQVCVLAESELIPQRRTSPITGDGSEIFVRWVDVVGRVTYGWLARTTALAIAHKRVLLNARDELTLTALDELRHRVAWANVQRDDGPWTLESYGATFGVQQAGVTALFRAALRELGVRISADASPAHVVERALRSILNRKEIDMSTKTTESKPAAKSAKTKAAKRERISAPGDARSAAHTASVAAIAALEKSGAPKTLIALAKRVGNGDAKKRDLIELRDGIKAQAKAARDANKDGVAGALSNVNRLVRRLARAAS